MSNTLLWATHEPQAPFNGSHFSTGSVFWHYAPSVAALTIAMTPVLIASGMVGHAWRITTRPG